LRLGFIWSDLELGLNWIMLEAWIYPVRPGAWVELDNAWGLDLSGQTWSFD
jgi:hypothetical protein